MSWNAKPKWGYSFDSDEAKENIDEIYSILDERGYTIEAISGIVGNMMAESGLNPWRWQSDTVSYSGGYGLFQYTPASGYINLSGTTPNLSTSEETEGATPEDGARQVEVFADNELGKWVNTCWRSYWSKTKYAKAYAYRTRIVTKYGNGRTLSMSQFSQIDVVDYAAFAFLACFEGPAVPNYQVRMDNAALVYEYISGHEPPKPVVNKKGMPIWMMMRWQ